MKRFTRYKEILRNHKDNEKNDEQMKLRMKRRDMMQSNQIFRPCLVTSHL